MSIDLHHRGAGITTDALLSRGTAVRLALSQEVTDRNNQAMPGEIRWCRSTQGRHSYGVSFKEDLGWVLTPALGKDTLPVLKPDGYGSVAEFVLNSINDGVFSVSRSCRITSFNRAAEKLTGWQRCEVVGKKCCEVFRSTICKECILAESIRKGHPIINHSQYITSRQGNEIPVIANATPLIDSDDKITGGVQVFRSVSSEPVPVVTIRTLGGLSLIINGYPVFDRLWKGRRSKELLKAIISLGGTKVSMEKLAFLLWPDRDGDHARNCLKTTLSRLRRVSGDDAAVSINWLAVKHSRVSLVQSVCKVDALEFKEKIKKTADSENAISLQQVLALYTNDFLPNDNTPWSNSFRDRLRKLFIESVLRLASLQNTKDDVLLAFLEQACRSDPLHEGVYACLMKHYINTGFPIYALDIFHKAEKIISQHTGLPPGSSLQSLALQAKKISLHH